MEGYLFLFWSIVLIAGVAISYNCYQWIYVFYYRKISYGYGLLTCKAIDDFLKSRCSECSKVIPTISIGNSAFVDKNGFGFKCSDCRRLILLEEKPNTGRALPQKSINSAGVKGHKIIYHLIKKIKKNRKKKLFLSSPELPWIHALNTFRLGVYGNLQSGEYARHLYEAEEASNPFESWRQFDDRYGEIPGNCPECGYALSSSSKEEIEKQGQCSSCGIQLEDMWTFRNNIESDKADINSALEKLND